jgi:hypothetical protein
LNENNKELVGKDILMYEKFSNPEGVSINKFKFSKGKTGFYFS